jgi:hypothetical protein
MQWLGGKQYFSSRAAVPEKYHTMTPDFAFDIDEPETGC